jgi:hypothetical protein
VTNRRKHAGLLLLGMAAWLLLSAGLAMGQKAPANRVEQKRPIKLGTSGGNINDRNTQYCCSGTLGSLLTNIWGVQFILTNNHVGARTNLGRSGDAWIQPGLIDQTPVCTADAKDTVANLFAFVPINFAAGSSNLVDAAIGQVVPKTVDPSGAILGIGTISSSTVAPSVGMKVKKSGRTSGVTTGKILSINATVNVQYQQGCGVGPTLIAKFIDQVLVSPGSFVKGGDSGSLIVENVSVNPRPVALLFAGGGNAAVGNTIGNVLSAFHGLSFVGGAAGAMPAGPGRSGGNDPRLEPASRIRARYEDFLLRLPEAVGNGVGFSEKDPDEPVIQLFVREPNERAHRAAPAALEGVRVEIVHTGELYALGCAPCWSGAKKSCK